LTGFLTVKGYQSKQSPQIFRLMVIGKNNPPQIFQLSVIGQNNLKFFGYPLLVFGYIGENASK